MRSPSATIDLYFLKWSSQNIQIHQTDVNVISPSPIMMPIKSIEALFAQMLKWKLIPKGYDVYHVAQQSLISILPSDGARIATVHDLKPLMIPDDYPLLLRWRIRKTVELARNLDLIIADSHNTKGDLCSLFDIPESKVRVIPLGVSKIFSPKPNSREKLGISDGSKIILHVGTEDKSKNIPFILKLIKMLSKKVTNLHLIRVGEKRSSTQKLIESLSLQNNVSYVRGLSDSEIAHYYSAANLLLFPSRYEGFGLPPLEAMASGCPVICSNNSSLPEVVGDSGITIPLKLDIWIERTYSMLTNSKLWEAYREMGLKRSRQFTWEKCAKETTRAYVDASQ